MFFDIYSRCQTITAAGILMKQKMTCLRFLGKHFEGDAHVYDVLWCNKITVSVGTVKGKLKRKGEKKWGKMKGKKRRMKEKREETRKWKEKVEKEGEKVESMEKISIGNSCWSL